MTAEDFEKQLGPFVLVQPPPNQKTRQRSVQLGARRTMGIKADAPKNLMSLLFELDDLLVTTLPPLDSHENLSLGRLPDCDVVVDDPSVSKHHATLSWNPMLEHATVTDLASSNGTRLNGEEVKGTRPMIDGDEVTFGAARFLFLRSKVLHAKLATGRFK